MMVNFGNRYTVLANLIRHLHDEVIRDNVSPNDAERFPFADQPSARQDLRLIGIIQSCAAIAFVLALGAMIAAYFDEPVLASALFLTSILLMMGSMLLFTREIQIANSRSGRASVRSGIAPGMGTISEAKTPSRPTANETSPESLTHV